MKDRFERIPDTKAWEAGEVAVRRQKLLHPVFMNEGRDVSIVREVSACFTAQNRPAEVRWVRGSLPDVRVQGNQRRPSMRSKR